MLLLSQRSKIEKGTSQSKILVGQNFDHGHRSTHSEYMCDTPCQEFHGTGATENQFKYLIFMYFNIVASWIQPTTD